MTTNSYNWFSPEANSNDYLSKLSRMRSDALAPMNSTSFSDAFSMTDRNYLPIGTPGGGASWWSNASNRFFGDKETHSMATPLAGIAQAGLGFYLGNQELKLAKDQYKTQKNQFARQFDTQKQLTNMDIQQQGQRMYDRNPSNNLTPEEYYEKNKLV